MTRVLVAGAEAFAARDLSIERDAFGSGVSIDRLVCSGDDAALRGAVREADAVLTDYAPISADVVAAMGRCRVISVAASGYDSIDVHAAAAANISVCAVGEYCTDEVADHTLLLILALARKLIRYNDDVQRDKRWQYEAITGLLRLRGRTLGIVGLGRIGRAVAVRARAFGMTIAAYDAQPPSPPPEGVTMVTLETLLGEADVVTLHCNLSDQTHGMFDYARFASMLRKPLFINVARGGLIVERDLVRALDDGLVSAAGLDVLDSESPDLSRSPFVGRDDLLLTPHVAFYSDSSLEQCRRTSAANIRFCLEGLHDQVDRYVHRAAGRKGTR